MHGDKERRDGDCDRPEDEPLELDAPARSVFVRFDIACGRAATSVRRRARKGATASHHGCPSAKLTPYCTRRLLKSMVETPHHHCQSKQGANRQEGDVPPPSRDMPLSLEFAKLSCEFLRGDSPRMQLGPIRISAVHAIEFSTEWWCKQVVNLTTQIRFAMSFDIATS